MEMLNHSYGAVVREIYATSLQPRRWPETLDMVSAFVKVSGITVLVALSTGAPRLVCSTSLSEANAEYARGRWYEHDIVAHKLRDYFWAGELTSARSMDLVSREDLETMPILAGFYLKFDIGQIAVFNVMGAFGLPAGLSFHRSLRSPGFTEAEMMQLGALARHIEVALRLSVELIDQQVSDMLLGEALTLLGKGAVVIDGSGTVMLSNGIAQKLLKPYGLRPGQQLQFRNPEVDESLSQHLIEQDWSAVPAAGPLMVLKATDSHPLLMLQVLPIDVDANRLSAHAHVLMVTPLQSAEALDPALLQQIYGLTPAQARLASLAATGMAISDLAKALDLAPGTAKLVLQAIYKKAGVARHPELVAELNRLWGRNMPEVGDGRKSGKRG